MKTSWVWTGRKKSILLYSRPKIFRKFWTRLPNFTYCWTDAWAPLNMAKNRINLTVPDLHPINYPLYRTGSKARELERQKSTKCGAWTFGSLRSQKGYQEFYLFRRRKFWYDSVSTTDIWMEWLSRIPIERMDECLDSLGEAHMLSTLDSESGYWKIEIDDRDREKTTFTSLQRLYRIYKMLFGLKNALSTFQRATNIILSAVKWQSALLYLDDVVLF